MGEYNRLLTQEEFVTNVDHTNTAPNVMLLAKYNTTYNTASRLGKIQHLMISRKTNSLQTYLFKQKKNCSHTYSKNSNVPYQYTAQLYVEFSL